MIIVLLAIQQIVFQIQMLYRTKTYSFKERHIFITGGSQGLGKCLAQRICKEGGYITIVARRENVCAEAKKENVINYLYKPSYHIYCITMIREL